MNLPFPAPQVPEAQLPVVPPSAPQRSWPRLLVNFLVALVVLAVAAAAFVLSYSGVHAVAIQGGVSGRLARVYPDLFDAVLVIACVAAVMLSGGRWWARCWAWLVIIVMLAAIGATDVAHAANYALPHRPLQGVVAAAPVVAVLLAFSLLITLLRNSRTRSLGAGPSRRDARRAAKQQAAIASVLKTRPPAPPIALPAATVALPVPAAPDVPDVPTAPQTAPSLIAPSPAVPSPTAPSAVLDESASPVTAPTQASEPASVPEEAEVLNSAPPLAAPVVPAIATEATDVTPPADVAGLPADADAEAEADSADPATDQAQEQTSEDEYWDADVDARLAGQVYPVEPPETDADLPADQSQRGDSNGDGEGDGDGDASGFAKQPQAPELDDDAPPFATAPFASFPRLNRVRATPTPPADADKDEDN